MNIQSPPATSTTIDQFYVVRPRRWLALILLVYVLVATRFALLTPPWQAPDEPAHYNYIAYIATNHALPVLKMGDYDHRLMAALLNHKFDPSLPIERVRYEAYQPPLYYLIATPIYWLSVGNLYWLRLYNVLLGIGVILVLYRCLELVFPGKPLINLGAAAFTAALPMHVAVTAAVNNDVLAELLVLGALLALLHWMQRQFYAGQFYAGQIDHAKARTTTAVHWPLLALGLLIGLGLLTKIYAYMLLPISVLTISAVTWRNQRTIGGVVQGVRTALWVIIPALLLGLPMWVRNARLYGIGDLLGLAWHDQVVVGQPRTIDWIAENGLAVYSERAFGLTFRSFWGVFGWLSVLMDERIYTALLLFSGVLFLGLLWSLVRLISGNPDTDMDNFQLWVLGLLGLILIADMATYIWYNIKFVQHQGRYFFWGVLAISTIVALGWREVMQPLQGVIAGFLALVLAIALGLTGFASGNLNKWTLLTLMLIALFLLLQPLLLRIDHSTARWLPLRLRKFMALPWVTGLLSVLRFSAWATPFVLLFLLDLLIPWLYIVPQLNY
jgi:4-amino-4-deoxy-L-arabinose transferase-like glycosyltransferase